MSEKHAHSTALNTLTRQRSGTCGAFLEHRDHGDHFSTRQAGCAQPVWETSPGACCLVRADPHKNPTFGRSCCPHLMKQQCPWSSLAGITVTNDLQLDRRKQVLG